MKDVRSFDCPTQLLALDTCCALSMTSGKARSHYRVDEAETHDGFSYLTLEAAYKLSTDQWDRLDGVLRMSTKYGFSRLRAVIIKALAAYWPSTLVGFDRSIPTHVNQQYAMAILVLARETDAHQLIPCAFYMMASSAPQFLSLRLRSTLCLLSADDLRRMLLGRDRLMTAFRTSLCPFFYRPEGEHRKPLTPGCETQWGQCRKSFNITKRLMHRSQLQFHTLNSLSWKATLASGLGSLCNKCKSHCYDQFNKGRAEVWTALPSYFGLEPWDKLLQPEE
jgi:hypothetical protein